MSAHLRNTCSQNFIQSANLNERGQPVVFWPAGSSCNEPKRVPIIPLAIKKEEEISS